MEHLTVKQIMIAAALTSAFVLVMHGLAHAAPPQRGARMGVGIAGNNPLVAVGDRVSTVLPQVIGRRPPDCPRAWCGCGLRKFLGLTDRSLNLAWEWAKRFPRTHAHSGAVAVRRHHVMQLVEHIGPGSVWMVRTYNDYKGLAWIRPRDVRGFVFVEPQTKMGWLR